MTATTVALILSGTSLVVSVVLGAWQIARYVLEGGRVKVNLERGWLDDYRLMRGPFRGGVLPEDWGMKAPDLFVEVAVMQVTNRGRTAVTVSTPSLDVSRERHGAARWMFWRRKTWLRHTIGPHLYDYQDGSAITTNRNIRLEPFDSAWFVMDVQEIPLRLRREQRKRRARVRGSIEVAGKRLRQRSSRRHAAVVDPGQLTMDPALKPTPELVTYWIAKRSARGDDDETIPPALAAFYVKRAHEQGEPLEWRHLQEVLEQVRPPTVGDIGGLELAIAIDHALQSYGVTDGPVAQR